MIMKKLKLESKLMLKREKIAELNANQQNAIKGGYPTVQTAPPQGTITCSCLGTWLCP